MCKTMEVLVFEPTVLYILYRKKKTKHYSHQKGNEHQNELMGTNWR